ncbi:hypothetical protein MMC12_000085 [Toensbergia leucococca]|nr:hypothetical protein [Toensbergia leucococca]
MLDGLFMLLTLSTVMAIASFLAGSLPLSFSMSQSQLRLISNIGMGVLIGTSLIVIIPEGVDTLYSASHPTHSHSRRRSHPQQLEMSWTTPQDHPAIYPRNNLLHKAYLSTRSAQDSFPFDVPNPVLPPSVPLPGDLPTLDIDSDASPPLTPTTPGEVHALSSLPSSPSPAPQTRTPHVWIGISLIMGFILMYLLDTLPSLASHTQPPPRTQNIYSLSDLATSPAPIPAPKRRTLSTTLGLCIHAAADGIALGASSSSTSATNLSFIIFLAIMVHKAPAAFGLTSVLLRQGLGKRGARAHLVIFSLAAPVGALGTWVIVRGLGGGGGDEEAMRWWTGVLLLFSGGTFLYVAMHTMQEDDSTGAVEESLGNGYLDGNHRGRGSHGRAEGKGVGLVLAAVAGMLLPLITQVGHAH